MVFDGIREEKKTDVSTPWVKALKDAAATGFLGVNHLRCISFHSSPKQSQLRRTQCVCLVHPFDPCLIQI